MFENLPISEHRKKKFYALKNILLERRTILQKVMVGDVNALKEISSEAHTEVISVELLTKASEEMQKIEEALQRMRTGIYGKCVDCCNNINAERLSALPYAERCLDCQRDHEKEEEQRSTLESTLRVLQDE